MKKFSDEEIVQRLKATDDRTVDQTLSYLHKQVYQMAVNFIKKYKGSLADAEDIFQDSLLALYKLARQGKLDNCHNVEAYLMAISKNLWFKQLKKKKETVDLEEEVNSVAVPEVALYTLLEEEKRSAFDKLLASLGENCQQLLIYFYYDRLRMKKIAELMGYNSEQVAKNRKSKCLQKLKTLLSENPHYKNYLT
ncbi:MAG: sigma-70 family RNA polymerase sigma factor [Bacteroidota bacterium]